MLRFEASPLRIAIRMLRSRLLFLELTRNE
jgi:hypothetical protein